MICYLVTDSDGNTKIVGTQADAKALNKDFEQIDIPTDKPGLIGWIQQMLDETLNNTNNKTEQAPDCDDQEPTENVEDGAGTRQAPSNPEPVIKYLPPSQEALVHWLFDGASQGEIEKIFETLGCRFGEAIRKSAA